MKAPKNRAIGNSHPSLSYFVPGGSPHSHPVGGS
jgi:hypothetical protein